MSTDSLEAPRTPYPAITPAQQTAAKVVGFLYLIQMALAIFAEIFVRARLIVPRDAVQTAGNIGAHERLFRISLAGDLIIYASVVVLFWGLYVILKPINKDVALLAVFFRVIEQAILAVTTLFGFIALRLLSNAEYLRVVDTAQLQALARAFLGHVWDGPKHRLLVSRTRLGGVQLRLAEVWLHPARNRPPGNLRLAPAHPYDLGHDGVSACLRGARNELHGADVSLRSRTRSLATQQRTESASRRGYASVSLNL